MAGQCPSGIVKVRQQDILTSLKGGWITAQRLRRWTVIQTALEPRVMSSGQWQVLLDFPRDNFSLIAFPVASRCRHIGRLLRVVPHETNEVGPHRSISSCPSAILACLYSHLTMLYERRELLHTSTECGCIFPGVRVYIYKKICLSYWSDTSRPQIITFLFMLLSFKINQNK